MIDIVGNIKVDESKPERIKYLLACIRSYAFMKDISGFYLNLDNPSTRLFHLVHQQLKLTGFKRYVLTIGDFGSYGEAYNNLLKGTMHTPFVINFMEDQFMLLDDPDQFIGLLKTMEKTNADICMSGFFQIEQKSAANLFEYYQTPFGKVYENSIENYTAYCRHYNTRYYIGCNFITTKRFARRFWNRPCGHRPHEYEIDFYRKEWLHNVMIPSVEIQVAVDDDHGEENSCILKRKEPKWEKIIREIIIEFNC